MSAAAEMKSLMITLLGIVIMILPTITVSMLYSLPSQAIAQYTAGTPYPYNPGGPAAAPPYSSAPPSYPYTQTPQQQQPLPALPSSPSSPQYILPSPQNPSLNTQQTLPPQSSSPLLAQPSSPSSSTNNTSAANITSTGTPPLSNPMQPQQRQLQPSQLPGGSIMTGPQMSSLTVITHLNNTDTGSASSPLVLNTSNNRNNNDNGTASFHQVVTNAYANPDGYTVVYHFFRGSQTGVVLNLPPGIYSVSDQSSNNTNNNTISNKTSSPTLSATSSHLTHTYSGDCNNVRSIAGDMVGYGQINLGEAKTCIITYNNSQR